MFSVRSARYQLVGSLDVSGSVNATSIIAGGPGTRTVGPLQIDCGTFPSGTAGYYSISFNFTFTNIPKVVASTTYSTAAYMFGIQITTVTTTGFTGYANQIGPTTAGSIVNAGVGFHWIAVG